MRRTLCLFIVSLFLIVPATALPQGGTKGGGGFKAKEKAGELRKFDEVITKDARSSTGLFTVHRIEDKIYFEIPKEGFEQLMLWQAEVAKAPAGISWGGKSLGHRVVRWDRRGNKVFLWQVSFAKRADGKAIQSAVDSANMDSIIWSFNVEAEGKDRAAVINATPLFVSEIPDFSLKGAFGGGASIDESRSYLEEIKAFPTNIEIRSLLTFGGGGGGGGGLKKGRAAAPAAGAGRSITALVHHRLGGLPQQPLVGRYLHPRGGYVT